MRMQTKLRTALNSLALAVLFGISALSGPAIAQQIMIKLEAPDGSVSIEGVLLGIENGFYVIQTAGSNTILVEADRIECVSLICPA